MRAPRRARLLGERYGPSEPLGVPIASSFGSQTRGDAHACPSRRLAVASSVLSPAHAQEKILRIAMTASDIPTTSGMPNNGFEGMRFLGFPIFQGLIQFDLTTDRPGEAPAGARRKVGAGARRQEGLDLSPAQGREIPRRHRLQRRCGDVELRAVLQQGLPQFEPPAAGISRARMPLLASWKKIDDYTVSLPPRRSPRSSSGWCRTCCSPRRPRSRRAARIGARWRRWGPAGTGPFKIAKIVPRQAVTLARNSDRVLGPRARKAKVDQVVLMPIPEANTRLAALRSGQVDWIEVPPPDGIPSLKQAGFTISTGSYPHVWIQNTIA